MADVLRFVILVEVISNTIGSLILKGIKTESQRKLKDLSTTLIDQRTLRCCVTQTEREGTLLLRKVS